MKLLICILVLMLCSFSFSTTATSPQMEQKSSDLVYRGEEWKFHDLVYRGEPVEIVVLHNTEENVFSK